MQQPYALTARAAHLTRMALAGCTMLLALAMPGVARAQAPSITAVSPTANARAAARISPVQVTFDQALTAGSAGALKVFSAQRGGLRTATVPAVVSGSTLTFTPSAYSFLPGETVSSTVTTAAASAGGNLATPRITQFTAAVGGTGRSAFVPGATLAGPVTGEVLAADFNNDGILDLADTGGGLQVRLGTGGGSYGAPTAYAAAGGGFSLTAGDLDNDGDIDLVVPANGTNGTTNGAVSVLQNNGAGVFTLLASAPVSSIDPRKAALGDLDGDLDMVVPSSGGGGTITVYPNNGSGTFTLALAINGPATNAVYTALGDVDNDGDLDFAVADYSAGVVVGLNNGTGLVFATSNVAVGANPNAVVLADLNGDGALDLATANEGIANLSVRPNLNTGLGTFGAGSNVAVPATTSGLAAGDMDADGDLDLVAGARAGTGFYLRLNDGTGTFSGSGGSAAPSSIFYLALADLDNDGDLDLAGANRGGTGGVYVRLNLPPAPVVSSFTPTSGAAGTSVVVTGTDFTGATAVAFGNIAASSFVVNSATQLTVTVPAGVVQAPISVTTPAGTGTSPGYFTVPVCAVGKVTVTANGPTAIPAGGRVTLTAAAVLAGLNTAGGFNNTVRAVVVQPDGKLLVGGVFTTYQGVAAGDIIRLNADGSRDGSFAVGTGFTGGTATVLALALQPDGKVLVGGLFTAYNGGTAGTANRIARLNADGSNNTGSGAGQFSIGTGFSSTVSALALQPDGKVLVGGAFTTYNGSSNIRIARLNADGSNNTGSLAGQFNIGTGFSSTVFALALQPDGKVLAGGTFTSYNGTTSGVNYLARLNADGTLNNADAPLAGATYVFNPGATTGNTRVVTTAGSYTATATDPATGCTYTSAPPVVVTIQPAPTITSFTPNPAVAGQAVTLTGTNLSTYTGLVVNGVAATNGITNVSNTSFTFRVPPTAPASGTTTLTTNSGTASSTALTVTPAVAPGNALAFDGVDDYVALPATTPVPVGNGAYTIEAWIKPTSMGVFGIIGWGNYGTNSQTNALRLSPTGIVNYWWNNDLIVSTPDLSGRWHHVAATYDGTTRRFFLDGVLLGQDYPSGHNVPNANNLRIGSTCPVSCGGEYFPGSIDEVRVYSVALTTPQLQADMRSTAAAVPASLVAYFSFEQGNPGGTNAGLTTVYDQTYTASPGTLTNFALTGATSNYVESYALAVPTAKAATGVSATGFTATWTAPAFGVVDNGYILDVSVSPAFASAVAGSPFAVASGTTSRAVTGLTAGTTYYYRVRADKTSVTGQGAYSNTIVVVPGAPVPPGNALAFDGVNNVVTYGATPAVNSLGPGNFTLEAWVYYDGATPAESIIRKDGDYNLYLSGNVLHAEVWNNGTGNTSWRHHIGTATLPANRWAHVAAVWTAATASFQLYVNGVADASTTQTSTISASGSLMLGRSAMYGNPLNGRLDEVRIYTTALSAADVQADMRNTTVSQPASLGFYANFDQGTAGGTNTGLTTLPDLSINGYNGTLSTFALTGAASNWVESYALVVPTALAANGITGTGFTARWTAPAVGVVDNGYVLDVSSAANFSAPVAGSPFAVASGTTSQAVTGLTTGTAYYYRVRADKTSVTGTGAFSNTITVTPCGTAPTAVAQNVTLTLDGNGNATLAPTAVNNGSTANCGPAPATALSVSPATFSCADLGPNNVVVTVTDANGNVSTAPATVTVLSSPTPVTTTTWVGNLNTDFLDCQNWSYGQVPDAGINAVIPTGLVNYPNLTTGTLAVRDLTIAAGASFTLGASAALQVNGNFANSGTATLTGPVQFVGSAATQTLSNSSGFTAVTVNKPSGTVQLAQTLTINSALTLTSGTLTTTGSYQVNLGSSASLSESETSYVLGKVVVNRPLVPGTAEAFGGLGLTLTPAASSMSPRRHARDAHDGHGPDRGRHQPEHPAQLRYRAHGEHGAERDDGLCLLHSRAQRHSGGQPGDVQVGERGGGPLDSAARHHGRRQRRHQNGHQRLLGLDAGQQRQPAAGRTGRLHGHGPGQPHCAPGLDHGLGEEQPSL